MTDARLAYEQRRYVAFRDKLLAEDPEIDERTLRDTLQGVSDYTDMLAATVRAALDDETLVIALKGHIGVLADRLARYEARADKRRALVREEMIEARIDRLAQPDFTASLRRSSPAVVIVDEKAIPQTFVEMRPHIRKRELLDALKDGAEIPGATLSNPGMNLSVRTK
jgi:hypothetical protein